MWICLNDGFISVVRDDKHPTRFKVRARNIEHLKTLFPKHKIVSTKDSDYRHRVFVSPDEVAALIASRIKAIDYDNFKNSVEDMDLHTLYADMWMNHYRYQCNIEEKNRTSLRKHRLRN